MTAFNLTNLQFRALAGLISIATNYDTVVGDMEDNCSWFSPKELRDECGWTAAQCSGVITGLLDMGAIVHADENEYYVSKTTYQAYIDQYGSDVTWDTVLTDLNARI